MSRPFRLAVASDPHYAGALEQARGDDYEQRIIPGRVLRALLTAYRKHVWARDPLRRGYLVDDFLEAADADIVVICGDLTCDTGFVGASDPAAFESADECLGKLRKRFGDNLLVALGDHDLGKKTLLGGCGGMRLESLRRMEDDLKCPAVWNRRLGRYRLIGITSSIVALPVFESEALPEELDGWNEVRRKHIADIQRVFSELAPDERVLLFCHDPTALPFLLEVETVRARLAQIETTFIGHLHSPLILWKSRLLAGMPQITFLGHTAAKLSLALRRARGWRPFKVVLCPALAGIQLLKDGGFYEVHLNEPANEASKLSLDFRKLALRPPERLKINSSVRS